MSLAKDDVLAAVKHLLEQGYLSGDIPGATGLSAGQVADALRELWDEPRAGSNLRQRPRN